MSTGRTQPRESRRLDTVPYATTLLVRDTCLCLHAQRAARILARQFDEVLRPAKLSNGQFSLLMSLNRPEPAKMASVAGLLVMDRTTLTAALKPLARRGLVRITVDANDRRVRRLELTKRGRAVLAVAVPLWAAAHEELEQRLKPGEAERLRWALGSLGTE